MTFNVSYCEICDDFVESTYPVPKNYYYLMAGFGKLPQRICFNCFLNFYHKSEDVFIECKWCGKNGLESRMISTNKYKYHLECFEEKKIYSKEMQRVEAQNYRARKKSLINDLKTSEWVEILKIYDFKCAYCGGEYQELEHIVPVLAGGGTTKYNVVPSCTSCNRKKRGQIWKPSLEMAASL